MSKQDQIKALGDAKRAARKGPNPFEDAARGRDAPPTVPFRSSRAGGATPDLARVGPGESHKAKPRASKLKRGRPKITAARPWETEGISRRTWYRRQEKSK